MNTLEDRVVSAIHEKFCALPTKSKPRASTSDVHEWVPLSGIAIIGEDDKITCLTLGTGMKCLPASKSSLLASGTVLHDWHAEILAIRAFNHFLLQECHKSVSCANYTSPILRRRQTHEVSKLQGLQQFGVREGLRIMMYCSEAPCGDASMELVMEAQEDPTPWPVTASSEGYASSLLGRGSFSQLGIVRRKPGKHHTWWILYATDKFHEQARADSPVTFSKSCSDKLALKQCTSLLSSPISLLVSPENAYIDTLILPHYQYRQQACERAFGPTGRMKSVANLTWPAGYGFRPFRVETTVIDFQYSRKAHINNTDSCKGSNISAVWSPRQQETLINGVLQGRRQTDQMGASAMSRIQVYNLLLDIIGLIDSPAVKKALEIPSYPDMKRSQYLEHRRRVKEDVKSEALKGWNNESFGGLLQRDLQP
ncbi:MAG: hypothetical protein ASARMPRED_002410 [Alectoria sarmentosa]|nr:MAG: hypothetical protein ASARMPRED_002410 [Alectoria sarmentosa]